MKELGQFIIQALSEKIAARSSMMKKQKKKMVDECFRIDLLASDAFASAD